MAKPNSTKPAISVVIPVKDEAKKIRACLDGILSQTIPVLEIIVIDSGSSDGTQEIVSQYPQVKLVEILPEQFNHGDTRNLGVSIARGEFILFTVGDARPDGENWISALMEGFTDVSVAGVCGLQVVEKSNETNPIDWYRPQSKPSITRYMFDGENIFNTATPREKLTACSWDNVNAIFRKVVLEKINFRKIVYGEDIYLAMDTLKAGYSLAYSTGSRVFHFHHNSYEVTLKRTITTSYVRYIEFGYQSDSINIFRETIRNIYRLAKEPGLTLSERLYWVRYNYNTVRAISSGLKLFQIAVEDGNEAIKKLNERHCGTPPIPNKVKL